MAIQFGDLHVDVRNAAAGSGQTSGAGAGAAAGKAAGKPAAKAKDVKLQGTTYVTNTGFVFNDESITADHLFNYKTKNIYGRGIQRKMRTMLFNAKEKYTVEMVNNGVTDEEQSKILQGMCDAPAVNLWLRMQQTFDDVFWFGIAPFNPVMVWLGNAYTLLELRHLPPHTFKSEGSWVGKLLAAGHFLKGIGLVDVGGNKQELQFFQTEASGSKQVQILDVFSVKEPDCELVAGDPVVFPLTPIFEMLKFSWNTRMQQVNRTGAPLMIAEMPAGSDENDLTAMKKMLRNWSKDTTFIPPEGVKITVIDIRDNTTVEEAIRMLAAMIIEYISPASLLNPQQAQGGTRLGGSDGAQQEMINQFIAGQLAWIANVWENFLTEKYLIPNGYDPLVWKVVVTIPSPSIDKSEVRLNQAQVGGNFEIAHPNEVREMLDLPDKSDEELAEIKAAWDIIRKPQQSPFGGFGTGNQPNDPNNPNPPAKGAGDPNKGTPDAAQAAKDKAAADAEKVAATQSIRRKNADAEPVEKDPLAMMITKVSNAVIDKLVDMEP